MKVSLIVLTAGKWQGKEIAIPLSEFVIGRDPQCHLRPSNPLISKRHCALLKREDNLLVHDFGSTNGTFVNDKPVKGELELHDGDRLRVGPLDFQVKLETSVPVDRRTPLPANRQSPSADEEAAALLLSGQESNELGGLQGSVPVDKDGIPTGSTIHESMPSQLPQPHMEMPDPAVAPDAKAEKSNLEKVKQAAADTSAAANAILTKYLRRPRAPA